jgi:hypothetical protein
MESAGDPRARWRPKLIVAGFAAAMVWVLGKGLDLPLEVYHENSWFENLEFLELVAAGVMFIVAATRSDSRGLALVLLGVGLCCLAVSNRELDLRQANVPAWVVFAVNGWPLRGAQGLAILVVAVLSVVRPRELWVALKRFFGSDAGQYMLIAFAFAFATWPFDRGMKIFGFPPDEEIEESLEVICFVYVFVSSLMALRIGRSPSRQ